MSKSASYETSILKLLFNATAITNVADNAAAPLTALSVALHTSDPGETGTQGTAEGGYAAYARVVTTRSTVGWVVTSGTTSAAASVSPVATVSFPACATTTTGTFTHMSIGASSNSTAGVIYYSGTVTPNINFGSGITPQLTTASSATED